VEDMPNKDVNEEIDAIRNCDYGNCFLLAIILVPFAPIYMRYLQESGSEVRNVELDTKRIYQNAIEM
jgi:hypothetical protein